MRCREVRSRERGQAAVEFALTLPILVIVVLVIFDFSRAIWYYTALAEAAREGTRFAIVHGASSASPVGPVANDATAQDVVRRFAFAMDANQLRVVFTWPNGTNEAGDPVRVEVGYTYVPLTGFIAGGASIPLTSTSEALIVY